MKVKLREVRKKNKYSLEQVAAKVGISKVYIWQIENCKRRLNYSLAIKIAKVFDMKPDELFYDDTILQIESEETKKATPKG